MSYASTCVVCSLYSKYVLCVGDMSCVMPISFFALIRYRYTAPFNMHPQCTHHIGYLTPDLNL